MASKKVRVEAPAPDFTGVVGGVAFADSVAEFDPQEHPGAYGYFVSAGYLVDGERRNDPPGLYAAAVTPLEAAPGTPDNPDGIARGATSRDAAVVRDADGPWSDAFLPPTNAGEADPHGPEVVSPGLHAVPPAPIRPGEVQTDDPAQQEADETRLAQRVLVDREPATIVASDEPPGGPLGLSDPGSVAAGIRDAGGAAPDMRGTAPEPPAKSAKVAEWRDFAVARGASPEDAATLTKDQLVERYGG